MIVELGIVKTTRGGVTERSGAAEDCMEEFGVRKTTAMIDGREVVRYTC
jgi:hypothetical protein